MFRKFLYFIFVSVFYLSLIHGLECPKMNDQVKECPKSGSTMLDDTYPVQAFVISNSATGNHTAESSKLTSHFAYNIFESYYNPGSSTFPQVILSVGSESEFKKAQDEVRTLLKQKNISDIDAENFLTQMTFRKGKSYTWQQDYFESFFDPKTGRPQVRKVDQYEKSLGYSLGDFQTLADAGSACGITRGEDLLTDPKSSRVNAEMGGNIEGAPGGFCLVGDNQGQEYSKSFCKNEDNIINLNVSFLTVGHVDELFKIIPTDINDGRPKECQFSLMIASPKKGLELLRSPNSSSKNLFHHNSANSDKENEEYFNNKPTERTKDFICKHMKSIHKIESQNVNPQIPFSEKAKGVFINPFKLFFFSDAIAGITVNRPQKNVCKETLMTATNLQFSQQISEDKEFILLNETIQESLDKDLEKIKLKILSRLPQCESYFDKSVLPVPNLFNNEDDNLIIDEKIGKARIKANSYSTNSIFPNPTNSVVMNKSIVFPDPENEAYSDYLKEEMKKRGLKYKSLKTWDYAHIGDGNIHCASHSLNYCKATP